MRRHRKGWRYFYLSLGSLSQAVGGQTMTYELQHHLWGRGEVKGGGGGLDLYSNPASAHIKRPSSVGYLVV